MSSKLVFITGATGFIGSQVVRAILNEGYRVRLSVRKPEQIQRLKELFPDAAEELQFVVIPDISQPKAFHDALTDVEIIIHLASPMPGKGSDLQNDYLDPAIRGTLSILEAAKEAPNVKRVIVTSSILALGPLTMLSGTNPFIKANTGEKIPLDIDKELPKGAPSGPMYSASKILAHQASRDWLKEQKPHFTLATLHPTFVIGPSLVQGTAKEIDGMNAWFWQSLQSDKPLLPTVFVDVRDVAAAAVKVVEAPLKNGTEFILSGPEYAWEDVTEFLKKEYPSLGVKLAVKGSPLFRVDVSSANEVLGIKWRSMEETVRGVADQQLSFGQRQAL